MNCKNHKEVEAGFACSSCGQPICVQCTVELKNKTYCRECLEKHISRNPAEQRYNMGHRKSKFFTFCLGFVPGAAHMYLGLINKGFSLMSFFFGTLFSIVILSQALYIHWLDILIAPLSILSVSYSVFDALAVYNDISSGKLIADESIISYDFRFDKLWENIRTRNKIFGNGLIIIGCIGILNLFLDTLNRLIHRFFSDFIPFSIQSIVVPILLIFGGIYLLRKGKETGV